MGTVLLFDIDGTLLTTHGAGRRAMNHAFGRVAGRRVEVDFPFGGMTDRAIARLALQALSIEPTEEAMAEVIAHYLARLPDELATRTTTVYDGVGAALDAVSGRPRVAVGLGTGNIRDGARRKLGQMFERFGFGGFGCDHETRSELLRMGAARGAGALGVELGACRVVVIGDTVRDVAAAHAMGAPCLAVTTGGVDRPALAAAGAELVVDRLDEPVAVDFLVG